MRAGGARGMLVMALVAGVSEVPAHAQGCRLDFLGLRTFFDPLRPSFVLAADLDADGDADFVTSGASGGTVWLARRDGWLAKGPPLPIGSTTVPIVSGEFTGDGLTDLLTASAILVGQGNGAFTVATSAPPTCSYGRNLPVDLDGDGDDDVLCVESGDLRVYLCNGDATFQPALVYRGMYASLAAGDLDDNGHPDVVAPGYGGLSVFLGDGTGSLGRPTTFPGTGTNIRLGDVDADGDLDAVTHDALQVQVAMGRGDGTLQPQVTTTLPAGIWGSTLHVGPVDGDAYPDLVFVDYGNSSSLWYLRGVGDGTFVSASNFVAASYVQDLALADVDGDQRLDAVTACLESLVIATGNGDGTFASSSPQVNIVAKQMRLADLDGDGIQDLVVVNDGVSVALGLPDGTFDTPWLQPALQSAAAAVSDLDGDGRRDIVAGGDLEIFVLTGDGNGGFVRGPQLASGTRTRDLEVADLDADGRMDVVSSDGWVWLGRNQDLPAVLQAVRGDPSIAVADFDGDGSPDVAGVTSGAVSTWLGRGDGTFSAPLIHPVAKPRWLAAGDFDEDGDPDLAVTTRAPGGVTVLRGQGDGTFAAQGAIPLEYPWQVETADLDGDDHLDLAVGIHATTPLRAADAAAVAILTGDGRGGFELLGGMKAGIGVAAPGIADIDRDGAVDLAAADAAGLVFVYRSEGLGILPADLPDARPFVPYAQAFSAEGGTGPFTFAVAAGLLAPGLALAPGGLLSGTPVQPGLFGFTVEVSDAAGCRRFKPTTVRVAPPACPPVELQPAALPRAFATLPYAVTLQPSGGIPPYAFAVAEGTLPPGLTLAPSGFLSGRPAAMGSYEVTLAATDALGCVGARRYLLGVVDTGTPDYLVGQGLGQPNPNRVALLRPSGGATAVDFHAYGAGTWGVNVAAGQTDADAADEILTGPGPGDVLGPQVRGFRRDATPVAKINFYAYGTLRYGVNVASDGIDGDVHEEILSGPGPGAVFGPHVRGFDVDGAAARPIPGVNFYAYGTLKYGVNVGAGDVESDGYAELLTGAGPSPVFASTVRGFDHDGTGIRPIAKINFDAFPQPYGVMSVGGDVDHDGFAELVAAPGPGPTSPPRFLGHDYDGQAVVVLPGFDATPFPGTAYGGRAAIGGVFQDGQLLASPGRDPSAPATLLPFVYDGAALLPGTALTPFPGGYGLNPGAGGFGY